MDLQAFIDAAHDVAVDRYPTRVNGKLGFSKGVGNFTPEQREVEARLAHELSVHPEQAEVEYHKRTGKKYGEGPVVIDSELARGLAGPGVWDTREQKLDNLMPTNGASAQFTVEIFWEELDRLKKSGQKKAVLLVMGAGGSGKGGIIRQHLDEARDHYGLVYKRVMSKTNQAQDNLQNTLEAGQIAELCLALRRPEDFFYDRIKMGFEKGKVEPLDQSALRYGECLLVFMEALANYRANPDPNVKISLALNIGEEGRAHIVEKPTAENMNGILWMLGLNEKMTRAEMLTNLQERAYRVFHSYEATNGRITDPFRTPIMGDQARGLAQAKLADNETIYAIGMTVDVIRDAQRASPARPWPRSAPAPA
jgi:hypothetical protein